MFRHIYVLVNLSLLPVYISTRTLSVMLPANHNVPKQKRPQVKMSLSQTTPGPNAPNENTPGQNAPGTTCLKGNRTCSKPDLCSQSAYSSHRILNAAQQRATSHVTQPTTTEYGQPTSHSRPNCC